MRKYIDYSLEMLKSVVESSISVAQVCKKLGLRPDGNQHAYISKKIRQYDLDTKHFLGTRANSGVRHVGGPAKLTPEKVLVNNRLGRKEPAYCLRRALVTIGRKEECYCCGLSTYWQNKPLVLQVHHVNGDPLDNRKENLQFVCPNCHTQTDNFCSKNCK